jgi:uncharacterized membrane protein YjdF
LFTNIKCKAIKPQGLSNILSENSQQPKEIFKKRYESAFESCYALIFCVHFMIKVNEKSAFQINNEDWIRLKIQKWKTNCLNRYDNGTLLRIVLVDCQGFEEIFTLEEEIDWTRIHWIRFMLHVRYTLKSNNQ